MNLFRLMLLLGCMEYRELTIILSVTYGLLIKLVRNLFDPNCFAQPAKQVSCFP